MRRFRGARPPRGNLFPLPPAAAAPAAPAWVPRIVRQAPGPTAGGRRRGRFAALPTTVAVPPPRLRSRRPRAHAVRHGSMWTVPPAAAPQPPPQFAPGMVRRRRPLSYMLRHGTLWPLSPAVAAPEPQAPPPLYLARRRTSRSAIRHGQIIDPPWPAIEPPAPAWAPPLLVGRRRAAAPRAGARWTAPDSAGAAAPPPRGTMHHAARTGPTAAPVDRGAAAASPAHRAGPTMTGGS